MKYALVSGMSALLCRCGGGLRQRRGRRSPYNQTI
jgi:hypothetical protein